MTTPRAVQDRYLPPDRDAFVAAEPPNGRVIVIAPTRAACETIELALGLHLDTVLAREHGTEIQRLAESGVGFGIVAGTGTGKTLAIRPIAETILKTRDLRVGVVNRESAARDIATGGRSLARRHERNLMRPARRCHLNPAVLAAIFEIDALLESKLLDEELQRPLLIGDGHEHRPNLFDP